MRTLEILLTLLDLAAFLALAVPRLRALSAARFLAVAALFESGAQVLLEGALADGAGLRGERAARRTLAAARAGDRACPANPLFRRLRAHSGGIVRVAHLRISFRHGWSRSDLLLAQMARSALATYPILFRQ